MKKLHGGLRQSGVYQEDADEMPLFSVITVCYNAVNVLESTINSILLQNYKNIEYIIIDGGSSDGTLDIIRKYEDRIHYWISEPDNGIYDAMNKGIRLAGGRWINFMNAGDRLLYLNHRDFYRFNHTFTNYVFPANRERIERLPLSPMLLTRNVPCHQSVIYHRDDMVPFVPQTGFFADFEQLVRIVKKGNRHQMGSSIVYFDEPGESGQMDQSRDVYLDYIRQRVKIIRRELGFFYYFISQLHRIRIMIRKMIRN